MAFKFVVFAAVLAYARAGFLSAPATYGAAPALAYGAAPALAYGAAAPVLGSTFHGSYAQAAPAVAYGASALAAPAITSQSSNILRSFGNLGQVSTYSKTVDTPFSSVRKADIRVSNPGLRIAAAAPALAYGAAPAISTYHGALAAPALAYGAAPALAYGAAPAIGIGHAAPVLGSTYHGSGIAAPALAYGAAPALAYRAAPALAYGAAPAIGIGHAAPVLGSTYHGSGIAAPALAYGAASAIGVGHAAPLLRSTAIAAPAALGVAYSPASAVSHINYASAYANYAW